MNSFLDNDFLLQSKPARQLYQNYAASLPIIDYHCHLSPREIAEDTNFQNITQAWLYGDHYKWRAMRTNGVNESFITGHATDEDKFFKWAETVPYTLRNPLYHWTHLELQRYFNIEELLNPKSAKAIYRETSKKLRSKKFSVRHLLLKMNVEVVCTTDDPLDSLQYHRQIAADKFEIKVLPAFRPDKAIVIEDKKHFSSYLSKLEEVTGKHIRSLHDYLEALKARHDYFSENGCSLSDHGLEKMPSEEIEAARVSHIFEKAISSSALSAEEADAFKGFILYQFALWDHEKEWVQQFHIGALRNNNSRMLSDLGADTGWDSIGDFTQGKSLAAFFDRLDSTNQLCKTIVYNLNPSDNELIATMIGNFNDGSVAGKMQFGSAWWFLDQKDGMQQQMNTLSNMGLISKFVGMITDSRSFLSYPRHEYFRRILCNLFGADIESGELPDDIKWTGKIIGDICYHNARNYFSF